jgi:serine phosphatase RsbU (regulator of sigma subunit)
LLFVPIVVLPAVFVYDVIRVAVDLEVGGSGTIRELAIVLSFWTLSVYLDDREKKIRRPAVKSIGRILLLSAGVLILSGFVSFFDLVSSTSAAAASSAVRLFVSMLIAGVFAALALLAGLAVRDLIFFKRRDSTRRNYTFYSIALLGACAVSFPFVPADAGFLETILSTLTILLGVVNAFRQNWIVYLTRREKIYTIVYSIILFVLFAFFAALVSREQGLGKALRQFSSPVHTFIQLQCIVGAIYFGMAFASTLFHLPTAEVFERKQSELSSLHNLSRLVTQVLDFNDLVNTVTSMTIEVLGAHRAWLELIQTNESTGEIRSETVSTKNISKEQIKHLVVSDGGSVSDLLKSTRKVMYVEDMEKDKRIGSADGQKKMRGSLLSVPLLSHENLIGVLHAVKESESSFDQDDIEVLSTFADTVTIAIENSRLIARSIERERLQQEMMLARTMQHRLLPQAMPAVETAEFAAASESSLEVGGDYFDFVSLEENHIGIIVGDVSGKGITAAFYMAEVKGIFLALSKLFRSPKELLLRTNQALRESIDRKAFISVVYATLDATSGKLTMARAGHCPAILSTANGTELIRPNGLGLGLADDPVFDRSTEERSYMLQPGDVCVFYTDGITEARNVSGDEYGYERLLSFVEESKNMSAELIKTSILQSVKRFTTEEEYRDDMTLVVLKWKGSRA